MAIVDNAGCTVELLSKLTSCVNFNDFSINLEIDSMESCYNKCIEQRIITVSDILRGEFSASYSNADDKCYCSALPCVTYTYGYQTYVRQCPTTTTRVLTTTSTIATYTTTRVPKPTPSPITVIPSINTQSSDSTTSTVPKTSTGSYDSTFHPSVYTNPTGSLPYPGIFDPTRSPSEAPISKLDAFANVKSEEIVIESLLYVAIAYSAVLTTIALIYLLLNRKQICSQSGRGSVKQTCAASGCFAKVFTPILNIIDLVTDFLFASNILLNYWENQILFIFGWCSLLTGILGLLLFIGKLMLMRKIMHNILLIKKDHLKHTHSRIRKINSYISCYDLLIAALEDCPQLCIVTMISIYLGFTNTLALIQFSVSLFSFFWTPFGSLAVAIGCCDDAIIVETNGTEMNTRNTAYTQVNKGNESSDYADGEHI
eukprot:262030_1